MTTPVTMEKIVNLAKRRGFTFQSSEIYGGLDSCWDYGPLGVELKRNVKNAWWRDMVQMRDDIVGIDCSILMHPRVWEASGHLAGFTDPLVDCRECKGRFRADHIADAQCPLKPSKAPGQFEKCDLTEARKFNLMFKTFMGPVEERRASSTCARRPRRASSSTSRTCRRRRAHKIPFGIAQIGKSFRNEITPGNFLFRTREFEQMEMEFFVKPGEDDTVVRVLGRDAAAIGTSRSASGPTSCACGRTPPTSSRTTPRAAPTSSTSSRSAGRSSRASPTAPTSTSSATPSSAART